MASLDFPSNPTNGQTYALNGVTYYYNSSIGAWLTQLTSMNLSTSSNTQVLFNDAGLANGSSGLIFDKTTGNLGLGSSSPTYRLEVNSGSTTTVSRFTSTGSSAYVGLTNSGASAFIGSDSTGNFVVQTPGSGYSTKLTVDTSGKVGVGTSTPNSALHLSSSSRTYISITANAKDWVIDHRGTFDSGSNALSFAYDGTERMRITSAGYVGIGNTAPVSPLHVAGEIFAGRVDSSSEGGQVSFARASDNSLLYAIDVNGTGSSPEFRLFNQAAGTVFFSSAPAGVNYIKFNPTQMAIGDANVLDDYEEGTWTPTIGGTSTNPTYTTSTAAGAYVKIGRLVYVNFLIIVTGVSGQGSGNIIIRGFPFSNGVGSYRSHLLISYNDVWDTAFPNIHMAGAEGYIAPTGVTQSNSIWGATGAGSSNLSTGYFSASGCYYADA